MNHVDQPTAALLRDAGWVGETEFAWWDTPSGVVFVHQPTIKINCHGWSYKLACQSIGELRERLTFDELQNYWIKEVYKKAEPHPQVPHAFEGWKWFADWLFTVTASADELAKVWMWVNSKKGE